jgi:transposase
MLEVSVRSTRRPACHHCGSLSVTGHGRHERRIRDRVCSYPCVAEMVPATLPLRRLRPNLPRASSRDFGWRRVTERFRWRLFERAYNEPFTDVAWSEKVSPYRVIEAFEHHAAIELLERDVAPPRVLAIEEVLPHARVVADKFHVIRAIDGAANRVRLSSWPPHPGGGP